MIESLLTTKFYRPPLLSDLVARPRLIEQLDAGLERALTLVSAPAGSGKTTLLNHWVTHQQGPVAWVSLDPEDNDPSRFWTYGIAALQEAYPDIDPEILGTLQSPQPPTIESTLTALINDRVMALQHNPNMTLVLILDDYHVIENPAIHESVNFLLDHMPAQMHLVIASRVDPPLSLSRLRGRRELVELNAADLRFTPAEIETFFIKMGLELTPEDIVTLETRTEGWIVGLQLAALSMQGKNQGQVTDFISTFTGSHRYVLDYLMEEVLEQQPSNVQDFLLQTSILDHLTGPLCDALTGRNDGQVMLEHLERVNLFIIPLDDERRWYRYQLLFANLLRNRLEQIQPGWVPDLHLKASDWYQTNGLFPEAVTHALMAEDIKRAIYLIEENRLAMLKHGELKALVRWLDTLPGEVIRARPWLGVAYAWTLTSVGRLDDVEPILQTVENDLDQLPENPSPVLLVLNKPEELPPQPWEPGETGWHRLNSRIIEQRLSTDLKAEVARASVTSASAETETVQEAQHITGHVAAIRAYLAVFRGNNELAMEQAHAALEQLPQEDGMTRGFAAMQHAYALREDSEVVTLIQATEEAIAISRTVADSHITVIALCDLAGLLILQGRLGKASKIYKEALELTRGEEKRNGHRLPVAGYVQAGMSILQREWNDLEGAVRLARQGVKLCRQWGATEYLIDCYIYLAHALQAAGDEKSALEAIQTARQAAESLSNWYADQVETHEMQLRLAQGDVPAMARWLQESQDKDSTGVTCYQNTILQARVLLAEGKPQKALPLLGQALSHYKAKGMIRPAIKILSLQALALQAQGKEKQALKTLERALSLAEPEGYVRIFIEEGKPMADLLFLAAAKEISVGYVTKLLTELGIEPQNGHQRIKTAQPAPVAEPSPLVDPLSKRELEVLQLLAAGLANKEIAHTLVVSLSTVKKHLKNIYSKLSVHNRTAAVAQARELQIL